MKKAALKLLAIAALFMITGPALYASHGQGADISYVFVRYDALTGRSTYFVTFTFYRDCSGTPAPTFQALDVNNYSGGGAWDTTVVLPLNVYLPCPFRNGVSDSSGADVSELCTAAMLQGVCSAAGGLYPGVQKYVYGDSVTLPGFGTPGYDCSNWTLGATVSHRNASTNINTNGNTPMYLEATINNSLDPATGMPYQINSPVFSVDPVPFECIQAPVMYNGSGISPDGDSLVYQLINPLQAHDIPISFVQGYDAEHPVLTDNQFSFDTKTSQMNYTPLQTEIDVLAIRISAYRHGVQVGSIIRDVQVKIINCESIPAVIGTPAVVQGGYVSGPNTITACQNSKLIVNVPASVASSSNITLSSSIESYSVLYPGMNFAQIGAGSNTTGHIEWQVGTETGCRYVYLNATTSDCPVSGRTYSPLRLCVVSPDQSCSPHSSGINGTGAQAFNAYLYPNPYQDNTIVHVDANQESDFNIRVTDLIGQVVLEQSIKSAHPFDVSLSAIKAGPGVYQVEVSDSHSRREFKLIKL
jgi:hypothetical protein